MLLETNKGEVHYEVHGPEGRPAVVLTHGAGLHCRMFDSQIEALRERYRVVVWDMPGHGLSHRLSGPLDLRKQADHVIAILDALGIDQAVLGGHSLGSWVSQYAALAHPNRVQGVVSLGGTPLHRPLGKLFLLFFLLYCEIFRLLPEHWLYRSAARMKAINAEAQAFYLQSLNHIGREQNYLISKGMAEAGRLQVSAFTGPLLLIHGEHENPKSTIKANAKWHEETPGSRLVVLPGAAHNANQDNPEAFNEALLSFLQEVED